MTQGGKTDSKFNGKHGRKLDFVYLNKRIVVPAQVSLDLSDRFKVPSSVRNTDHRAMSFRNKILESNTIDEDARSTRFMAPGQQDLRLPFEQQLVQLASVRRELRLQTSVDEQLRLHFDQI